MTKVALIIVALIIVAAIISPAWADVAHHALDNDVQLATRPRGVAEVLWENRLNLAQTSDRPNQLALILTPIIVMMGIGLFSLVMIRGPELMKQYRLMRKKPKRTRPRPPALTSPVGSPSAGMWLEPVGSHEMNTFQNPNRPGPEPNEWLRGTT